MKFSISAISALLSNDIGIDLGTANTLVYAKGQGIVVNEPSIVALDRQTSKPMAIGAHAKEMLGRENPDIQVVRPLKDGVIADFDVTEEMLRFFIKKVQKNKLLVRPRIVICVPSGVTAVEMRAVRESAERAGAREVYLIKEPMAAAIGIGLPVEDAVGSMVIDIGGGTTEIAVIALSGIVTCKSIKTAGDRLETAAPGMTLIQKIDSGWEIAFDPEDIGLWSQGIRSPGGEARFDWKKIRVGEFWENQGHRYNGAAFYRVSFKVPEKYRGKKIYIVIGGLANKCAVHLNTWDWIYGVYKGTGLQVGAAPLVFPARGVRFGDKDNQLRIYVRNPRGPGGIYKPVWVAVKEPTG